MMNIVTWRLVGYNMIIMYAALRSIPHGAVRDGRDRRRQPVAGGMEHQDPGIRPAIILTVIFSIIGTFQLFNGAGACCTRSRRTWSINGYTPNTAYNLAFTNQDV